MKMSREPFFFPFLLVTFSNPEFCLGSTNVNNFCREKA